MKATGASGTDDGFGISKPSPTGQTSVPVGALSSVAIETWRLGRRIGSDPAASERMKDSYERLARALAEMDVEVRDPTGERYLEGTNADVIDMPDGAHPSTEFLLISEALRPAVFHHGRCVVAPQIMVERPADTEA